MTTKYHPLQKYIAQFRGNKITIHPMAMFLLPQTGLNFSF